MTRFPPVLVTCVLLLTGCATDSSLRSVQNTPGKRLPPLRTSRLAQRLPAPPNPGRNAAKTPHKRPQPISDQAWRTLAEKTQAEAAQFAILHHASQLPRKTALGIWTQLWHSSPYPAVRTAALTELFKYQDDPQKVAQLNLLNRDRELVQALRAFAYQVPDGRQMRMLEALTPQFQHVSPDVQVMLLFACAQQGEPHAFSTTLRLALNSPHEQVLTAALAAIPALGDLSDFPTLMKLAGQHPSPTVRAAAQTIIQQLNWPALDSLIATNLTADPPHAILAIRLLMARKCSEHNGQIALLYHSKHTQTAIQAVDAMAVLGTPEEIPDLMRLQEQSPNLKRHAGNSILCIRQRASKTTAKNVKTPNKSH